MTKGTTRSDEMLATLKSMSDPGSREGLERFGIKAAKALGVPVPKLREIARRQGKDHELAEQLWASGIHEARILASMVDDPKLVTEAQMERWVGGFDSWDVCDQCCGNLFDKTPFAQKKAVEWSASNEEFTKRAGFVMMAELAVHDKKARDEVFLEFLSIIKKSSDDERNFIKKAVNWALRQIGKRNLTLHKAALLAAKEIKNSDSKAARWVASDAIRELESEGVKKRLASRKLS